MKLLKFTAALLCLLTMVTTSYAGPTTNEAEYAGDKSLTKEQQAEFQTRMDKGLELFDAGKYEDAEKEFKTILAFAPKKNLPNFNLGLVKYKQGDYKTAIDYFDKVIKGRSYYVGAAFYYKSICQYNLDQVPAAKKTAKRFTQNKFFYGPALGLAKTFESGSDEFLDNAKAAFADQNYELCLVELEESVLADTAKGKELTQQCKTAMQTEEGTAATVVVTAAPDRKKIWLDARYSQTDNAYQENTNTLAKALYSYQLGAEYVKAAAIDFGLGVTYDYSNAVDLTFFKDEVYGVYAPFFYRDGANRYAAEVFYNLSKNNDTDAYSEHGFYASYFYAGENYLAGIVGTASNKVALNTTFDYRKGSYTNVRLIATRYIGKLSLTGTVGVEDNLSGNQPIGTGFIPFAHKALRYGAAAAYDLTDKDKLTLRGNAAKRDYLDVISVNKTDRDDTYTNVSLTYQHVFNHNVKAWLQQTQTKNDSNFGNAELINKNYTENISTLGLSLVAF